MIAAKKSSMNTPFNPWTLPSVVLGISTTRPLRPAAAGAPASTHRLARLHRAETARRASGPARRARHSLGRQSQGPGGHPARHHRHLPGARRHSGIQATGLVGNRVAQLITRADASQPDTWRRMGTGLEGSSSWQLEAGASGNPRAAAQRSGRAGPAGRPRADSRHARRWRDRRPDRHSRARTRGAHTTGAGPAPASSSASYRHTGGRGATGSDRPHDGST